MNFINFCDLPENMVNDILNSYFPNHEGLKLLIRNYFMISENFESDFSIDVKLPFSSSFVISHQNGVFQIKKKSNNNYESSISFRVLDDGDNYCLEIGNDNPDFFKNCKEEIDTTRNSMKRGLVQYNYDAASRYYAEKARIFYSKDGKKIDSKDHIISDNEVDAYNRICSFWRQTDFWHYIYMTLKTFVQCKVSENPDYDAILEQSNWFELSLGDIIDEYCGDRYDFIYEIYPIFLDSNYNIATYFRECSMKMLVERIKNMESNLESKLKLQ